MEEIRFKSRLFGFKRRQVLEYIDSSFAAYEQQLEHQSRLHQAYQTETQQQLADKQTALDTALEQTVRLQEQVDTLSAAAERSNLMLANRQKEIDTLRQEVQQARTMAGGLQTQIEILQQQKIRADDKLAEKDRLIAKQALEVTKLHDSMEQLEEQFRSVQVDAEQSTAMVNCLNLLHGRNRALTKQVARLQAQLENQKADSQVAVFAKAAAEKQETVKTTENLFATVRKEIQDALDSISDKIENGAISQGDDGNYFVDMANL